MCVEDLFRLCQGRVVIPFAECMYSSSCANAEGLPSCGVEAVAPLQLDFIGRGPFGLVVIVSLLHAGVLQVCRTSRFAMHLWCGAHLLDQVGRAPSAAASLHAELNLEELAVLMSCTCRVQPSSPVGCERT